MTLLTTSAQAAPPPPRPRSRFRLRKEAWVGWGFAGPFVAVFGLVFLAPIGYALYLSLFRERLIGGTSFVGIENYADALTDPRFWDGLLRVGLFLLVQVPVMLGIALLVALAIDSGRLYGANFFRVAVFLPYAVPAV
ncbi:carbohydrate ABC transporter permease, partial [Streptomyces hydrogenans]|uniref:carbohydrate ABC transporter permease n=1 Tax=Streptomyces hydrogenans TaxID=1873719 RepID=UPI0036409D5B